VSEGRGGKAAAGRVNEPYAIEPPSRASEGAFTSPARLFPRFVTFQGFAGRKISLLVLARRFRVAPRWTGGVRRGRSGWVGRRPREAVASVDFAHQIGGRPDQRGASWFNRQATIASPSRAIGAGMRPACGRRFVGGSPRRTGGLEVHVHGSRARDEEKRKSTVPRLRFHRKKNHYDSEKETYVSTGIQTSIGPRPVTGLNSFPYRSKLGASAIGTPDSGTHLFQIV
jgi:hypothetical protein